MKNINIEKVQGPTTMLMKTKTLVSLVLINFAAVWAYAAQVNLDESPAQPGEWGYRPAAGGVSAVNPPSFSWRPQRGLTFA